MDFKELLELINAVDKSSLSRFSYKEKDTSIEFEKKSEGISEVFNVASSNVDLCSSEKENVFKKEEVFKEENFEIIKSPLIGTFYNCPSPKENPFVSVGDNVLKGQVIGIIEVMKMMNEVKCDFDGVVEEILIENNDTVEYGQNLVKIKLL